MSELSEFRDHARRLSESAHRDDCDRIHRITKLDRWLSEHALDVTLSCSSTEEHEPHEWLGVGLEFACPGLCGGCMPDAERVLWTHLADEIDAHLSNDDEPLWEQL